MGKVHKIEGDDRVAVLAVRTLRDETWKEVEQSEAWQRLQWLNKRLLDTSMAAGKAMGIGDVKVQFDEQALTFTEQDAPDTVGEAPEESSEDGNA
jgi:hypothetical protein